MMEKSLHPPTAPREKVGITPKGKSGEHVLEAMRAADTARVNPIFLGFADALSTGLLIAGLRKCP
jgi:hypothetical protein